MAQRVRVRYSGRVQGVGFRATALSIARAHPVTGWVRNDPDGAVTLETQGEAEATREFLEALGARMGDLILAADETSVPIREDEQRFEIRR